MEREWKLGNDLLPCDNLLDGVTFEDVMLAVHCNCPTITKDAVQREASRILEQRLEDFKYILSNNLDEIVEWVAAGRG